MLAHRRDRPEKWHADMRWSFFKLLDADGGWMMAVVGCIVVGCVLRWKLPF